MRYVSRALLAAVLGLAAAFLAACGGSSGLLSASEANSLNADLNTASADVSSGNCVSAEKAIGQLETQVANLPGSVNPTLVSDLSRGAQTVHALARTQCGASVGTGPDTTTTATSTTPTTTHPHTTSTSTTPTSTTTQTTTTPPPPTTTSTTPATPTPTPGTTTPGGSGGAPAGGGNGQGQGNGD